MKLINNDLQFSISDIVQYFKSPYASYATWSNLQNPGHISVENNLIFQLKYVIIKNNR